MRSNLARLEARTQGDGRNRQAQRNALLARYDAQCRQRIARRTPERRGFFEQLFGGGQRYREMPIQPPTTGPIDPDEQLDQGPRHGPKAVCVRTCDGGFFPVSYSARRRNLPDLNDLCEALCPNTEVKLFTYIPGRDINQSVSIDGEPYSDLANAGKYKTTYNPSCTCKPPGKSWARVLQRAEGLLDNKSRRDVIVTVAKSRELSKPKLIKPKKLSKKEQRKLRRERAEAEKQRKELEAAEKRYARDAEKNKAGIATGNVTRRRVYSLHDGQAREIKGPDGVKRKIRIIAPRL